MRAVSVASDLFDLSIHFISYLFISFIFLLFLLPYTFNFHDVVDNKPAHFRLRSWAPWPKKNFSTGYEPNDHFIIEAYVEYTQESLSEQRFPEDITIGQTLVNACRRRSDHSEEGRPVVLSVVVVNES